MKGNDMAKEIYRDVNKANYLEALFLDIQKQCGAINYVNASAKVIAEYVMINPTGKPDNKVTSAGFITDSRGAIILHRII